MRIGLMANIPNQPVIRRVEDIMQSHRQLNHTQPGGKMPTGTPHAPQQVVTQFVRQRPQIFFRQTPQLLRGINLVQQGCIRALCRYFIIDLGHGEQALKSHKMISPQVYLISRSNAESGNDRVNLPAVGLNSRQDST